MRSSVKKLISLLLSVFMLVSTLFLPVAVQAEDMAEAPVANPAPGDPIADDTPVTLTSSTSGAAIYFTVDGNDPVSEAAGTTQVYSEENKPVINGYTIIKAVAAAEGMEDSGIAIFEYNISQKQSVLGGVVMNPDNSFAGGAVELFKVVGDWDEHYDNFPVDPDDGSFSVSADDLEDGEYRLRAFPPAESLYSFSDWFNFKVTDGEFLNTDDTPVEGTIQMTTKPVQVSGTMKAPNEDNLDDGIYDIRVRSVDFEIGNNVHVDWSISENVTYKLSDITTGAYVVWLEPQGDSDFTASHEHQFTIDESAVYPIEIPLQLTNPQFNGTVALQETEGSIPSPGGVVEIFDNEGHYLKWVSVKNDGTYKIGGLDDGSYQLSAIPPFEPEYSNYRHSDMVPVEISGGNGPGEPVEFLLVQKELRVDNVDYIVKGDNEVRIRLNDLSVLDFDFSGLRAVIGTDPEIELTNGEMRDWHEDSATLFLNNDTVSTLDFGTYTIDVYNNLDLIQSCQLVVIQNIIADPKVILPEEYRTVGKQIVFEAHGNENNDYPWDTEGNLNLTVEIRLEDGDKTIECTPVCEVGDDNRLTVTIPAQAGAAEGGRSISVYDGDQLLAKGYFQIGTPVIDGTEATNQGDHRVLLMGSCLEAYEGPDTIIEVYKDGTKVNTGNFGHIDHVGMVFWLNSCIDIPGEYMIKLIDNSDSENPVTIEQNIPLKVLSRLECHPHGFSSGLLTVYNSTNDLFKWSISDGIENFSVSVYGDGFHWSLDSQSGMHFDDDGNLAIPLLEGHEFPQQAGSGRVDIYRSNIRIGFAEFTIGQDLLCGTVVDPQLSHDGNGRVFITNLDSPEHYSRSVNTDENGRFYISIDDVPRQDMDSSDIDGNYSLQAYPAMDSECAKSEPVTIEISDGQVVGSDDIMIVLEPTQISGVVKDPEGNVVVLTDSWINIYPEEPDGGENNYLFSLFSDGTFRIGGLSSNTSYRINIEPFSFDIYFPSRDILIPFGDTLVTDVELVLESPQFRGNVFDADDTALQHDEYNVSIQRTDNDGSNCIGYHENGYFTLSHMDPGTYSIRIIPKGDSDFAPSIEESFTIDLDGTATPETIDLSFTEPQVNGSVVAPDGETLITAGSVVVLDSDGNYLFEINIQSTGVFRLGGLPAGDYILVAKPDREDPDHSSYDESSGTIVTIAEEVVSVELSLRDKAPRIVYADNYVKGDSRLRARIMNASMIENWENVSVEIWNSDSQLIAANENCWSEDHDPWSDECSLNMDVDTDLFGNLPFGVYTLKVFYYGDELDVEKSDQFRVVSGLHIRPAVVEANEYAGEYSVEINRDDGVYPWSSGDELTAYIIPQENPEHSLTVPVTINAGNTLSFTLQEPDEVIEGRQFVEIYKDYDGDRTILAVGQFDVGTAVVEYIRLKEYSSFLHIQGEYLNKYMDSPRIEVYQEDNLIAASNDWYDDWGNITFNLPFAIKPGIQYSLKLYAMLNGEEILVALPDAGAFKAAPRLVSSDPVISGNTGDSFEVDESDTYTGYGWSTGDNVAAVISGPGYGDMVITSENGLAISEDKITFTAMENDRVGFPLEKGDYSIWLYNADDGTIYGYADFYVENEAYMLKGTVLGSDGTPSSGGRLTIEKEDGWSESVVFGKDGKFYYLTRFMPGNDTYKLIAYADAASDDYSGEAVISLSEGTVLVDGEDEDNVIINLEKAQIEGTVMEGENPTKGGEVNFIAAGDEGNHYQAFIEYDGTYKMGGLNPGVYDVVAFAGNGSEYLSSERIRVTLEEPAPETAPEVRNIDLRLPQVTGTVTDVAENSLDGGQYWLEVRKLDSKDGNGGGCDWRAEDGKYLLGGMEPGTYGVTMKPKTELPYSQSYEKEFTIEENGTVTPSSVINLALTDPKLIGYVYDNSNPANEFTEAGVDVFKGTWTDMEFVTFVPVDVYGIYRIGGIPNGTYYIRAVLTNRDAYPDLSQSLLTQVTISDTPASQNLYLRDTDPRIRFVEDYDGAKDKLKVRIFNMESMDLGLMVAEILDGEGNSLTPAIYISGADKFEFDWGNWDYNKDEGDILIFLDDNRLMPGGYNLRLTYDGQVLENDTPVKDGFNGFNVCYSLNAAPFAMMPGNTAGRTVELGLDMKPEDYPWSGDDDIVVELGYTDGTTESLSYTINDDNTINAVLPDVQLEEGMYKLTVIKGGLRLAKGMLSVNYPVIKGICDATEIDSEVSVFGDDLIIYEDDTTAIRVYDEAEELVAAASAPEFMWDRLAFSLGNTTLEPGRYRVELEFNGQAVDMTDKDILNVVNNLMATPNYKLTGTTDGNLMTFTLRDGSDALWETTDDLLVKLVHQGYMDGSVDVVPETVDASSITIRLPNILNPGQIDVRVVRGAGTEEEHVAFACFEMVENTQLTGKVKDNAGNAVPYAYITVTEMDGRWVAGYSADVNGDYAVYGLHAGKYNVFAGPPEGLALLESERKEIEIADENTSYDPHDFILNPGLFISGSISLPDGDTAQGDMEIHVSAWFDNDTYEDDKDDEWYGSHTIVSKGGTSADYSVVVPDNKDYRLEVRCGGWDYIDAPTYYSSEGSVYRIIDADHLQVSGSHLTDKDVTLIRGKVITGTISIPSGIIHDDVDVEICAVKNSDEGGHYYHIPAGRWFVVKKGSSSVNYKIVVPEETGYEIYYFSMNDLRLMEIGYYKTPNETVSSRMQAASIDVMQDLSGIDLTMIPAKYISGTVTLPEAAPGDGIGLEISVWDDKGTKDWQDDVVFGTDVKIPGGQTYGDYVLKVPDDETNYRMQIWGGNQADCVDMMYYSHQGSAFSIEASDKISVADGDLDNINFIMVKGKKITGVLTIPEAAPAGGQGMSIEAAADFENDNERDDVVVHGKVMIPEGESSEEYTLIVPELEGYRVKYVSDESYDYMNEGFYAGVGETTLDYANAVTLDMTEGDKIDIDLTVTPAKRISGTITLPQAAPAEGAEILVSAFDINGTQENTVDDKWFGTVIWLDGGSSGTDYMIKVPDDASEYYVQVSKGQKLGYADVYYSIGGNVYSMADANSVSVAGGDVSGIDIEMETGSRIAGTITLPDGMTAPDTGYDFRVVAVVENDISTVLDDVLADTWMVMDEGITSLPYELVVPKIPGYKLAVIALGADELEMSNFYSADGVTNDISKADEINAEEEDEFVIDIELAGNSELICKAAEVEPDGAAVMLEFNKPLDKSVAAGGFMVEVTDAVDEAAYELNGVTYGDDGTQIILELKDYKIYKDYKSIKVSYSGEADIKAYDGKTLAAFADMPVVNSSTQEFSISGVADGGLYNRDVTLTVKSTGDEITITGGSEPQNVEPGVYIVPFEVAQGSTEDYDVTITVPGRRFAGEKVELSFAIDKESPTVTIDVPELTENSHAGVVPVVSFFGDDEQEQFRVITLNGYVYKPNTAIKEAGSYTITASTKDEAGNTGTDSETFVIEWDNTAPVINVANVDNGEIYESVTPVISLNGGSNIDNYTYTAKLKNPDGSVVTYNSGEAIDTEGAYRLEVIAVNPSYTDITSSKVIEFTIDNEAPSAAISNASNIAGSDKPFNTAVTPVITFTDTVASQQILTANAEISLTRDDLPVTYKRGDTITADGSYTLTAKTSDAYGHESNLETKSFAIDRTKPVIKLSGATNGNTYKDIDVTVEVEVTEGTLTVKENGQEIDWNDSSKVFTGEDGQVVNYDLEFIAVDEAGNEAAQTLKFTIDRLPVNISISGVAEGMVTNADPYISFMVFEGEEEKQGASARIDGTAFAGGRYSIPGSHTLTVEYVSGENTYTRTVTFTIDKTVPQIAAGQVMKNDIDEQGVIYTKAGDTVKVTADITDVNGVGDVWFSIGTVAVKVPMKKTTGTETGYEGSYTIEGGNYSELSLKVHAKDKAGNTASLELAQKVSIDNSKPVVNVRTAPGRPDGNNGIYKAPDMSVTISAGVSDRIEYYFNGVTETANGSVTLSELSQGINTLLYSAVDAAGNKSDEKVFIFEYDSERPSNVTVHDADDLVNSPITNITGEVAGEGGKTGSRVMLRKAGEIIGQAVITSAGEFVLDGVRLAEGENTFALKAIDRAGNESEAAVTVTITLDSTAPIVRVDRSQDDELIYNITVNEAVDHVAAKFNGAAVDGSMIESTGEFTYTIEVAGMLEGSNTLNVTAEDEAGNIGAGSFTSTYIPADTEQNDVPLNDNASMDIPAGAFTGEGNVQMLVKTVDVQGTENYKPLGAPISFEFSQGGTQVEPQEYLIIRNYIGTGLTGVVLMHIDDDDIVGNPVAADITTSDEFDEGTMGAFDSEDPKAYYLSDTGYLIFKTKTFSAYQVAQDNTAPVIAVETTDFEINKADYDAGKCEIKGTLTDEDPDVHVMDVRVDGVPIDISGIGDDSKDETFSIPLSLSDGTHEVVLKATDTASNTSSITRTYQVDTNVPELTVDSPVSETNRNTAELTIVTNENCEIWINDDEYGFLDGTNTITVDLDEGTNTFNVVAEDSMGNIAADSVTVTRDSTAPAIVISGISDGDITGGPIDFTVGITDANRDPSAESITLDGDTVTSPITDYNTDGTHTLVVSATDSYGNVSEETLTFTIDNSAPTINITGAADGSIYAVEKTLEITANNADNLRVTKAVDGGAAQEEDYITSEPLTSSVVLQPGDNAQHSYTIRATALKTMSGQVRTAVKTIEVIIDRKDPVITSTTAAQTESATINIAGTIDEEADLYINDVLAAENRPAGSFMFGRALEMGDNVFVIKAVDAAGNESTITITVKRVEPQQDPGDDDGDSGGGIFFPPASDTALEPFERRNSGELPEVEDPQTGSAIDWAENTEIGTNGGIVETEDGAFKLTIEGDTVNDQENTFRIVVFELDPQSPLALEEQIKSGSIMLASEVVDFSTDAEMLLKPVKATFKYDLGAVTNPRNLRVYYWNVRANTWVPVAAADTVISLKDRTVEATLKHFTRYTLMEVKSRLTYSDVQNQWHSTYVERASLMGIINGYVVNDIREFRPNAPITRVEFVSMLARVLKLDISSTDVSVFKDAADIKNWAKGYIKAAYEKGIISPYGDGTFKPAQDITREEMAVMIIKAMGLRPAGNGSEFKDRSDITINVRSYVSKAAKMNIIVGKGNNMFYPKDSLTRAEASKVLIEMIEVLGIL